MQMKNKNGFWTRNKILSFAVCISLLLGITAIYYLQSSSQYTQFDMVVNKMMKENSTVNYYINENFDSYGGIYSLSIDNIDNLRGFSVLGNAKNMELSDESYGTEKSVSFLITNSVKGNNYAVLVKRLDAPMNLSRWNKTGYLSLWVKIENRIGIPGVSLRLVDKNGNFREYSVLPNMQINDPVLVKVNGLYPDIAFQENDTANSKWQDFRLVSGWNFLFWRMDSGYFNDYGEVNLSQIARYEIVFSLSDNFSEQMISVDNLRVEDGLQKIRNPTNGNWYPPNDAPQYGIFDIDETYVGSGDYVMNLLNVKQPQYPSNGDHTRILSNKSTPMNFIMQMRFKIKDLPQRYQGSVFNYTDNRKNTWIRVQYDFDNEYDPGHDWFGFFISIENDNVGLVTTYPITRYFEQGQEPTIFNDSSRKPFSIKEDVMYVLNLNVVGQKESAIIYQEANGRFEKLVEVEYTFVRQRYKDKRYPISIETTGNVKAEIHSIEVVEI